ncbi:MAG: hypothetical protein RMK79_06855, partial [Anaerolineae bacterium]|nr:hypothetical protein [Anaerolineae bacterium]
MSAKAFPISCRALSPGSPTIIPLWQALVKRAWYDGIRTAGEELPATAGAPDIRPPVFRPHKGRGTRDAGAYAAGRKPWAGRWSLRAGEPIPAIVPYMGMACRAPTRMGADRRAAGTHHPRAHSA